jgi:hypothetical protein
MLRTGKAAECPHLGRQNTPLPASPLAILPYREIWCLDFEFRAPDGERPEPHCMVARELRSGRELRLWRDELEYGRPPFRLDDEVLFVAYYASAELGCFLALGWPMPARVLDLYVEFRATTNGLRTPCGSGLLGALAYYGLDSMVADEKEELRGLAMLSNDIRNPASGDTENPTIPVTPTPRPEPVRCWA